MKGFQELVDGSYAKVFYHAIKHVRNDHDAADITQNTFFKAFLRYDALRKPESAESWLFTICNNEIKQFYRDRVKPEPMPEFHEIPDHGELYAAIDQLSASQRQVILLKYFGGYSMQELTILLSCNVATVKSRLYEARQAIKKIMNLLSPETQSKRRKKIMSIINLCESGAETIPCLSMNAQQQLLKSAEANEKFTADVLAELAKIPSSAAFLNACNGILSYDEFIKILACCDDATIYRIAGKPYYDWRSAPNNRLIKDIGKLQGHNGYIDSVETILYVPSLRDTCHWDKQYLGWDYGDNEAENEKWGHANIRPYANHDLDSQFKGFYGFHLLQSQNGATPDNVGAFIFVSGGLEAFRASLTERGWDKISEVHNNGWGTNGFTVTDLNGFNLQFCEWACD